ncbi:hypothetical protein [Botrimarina mediterranea]|nr:hypothetical protein K2D_16360 [Planctomycetes bacterium K2D]
MPDFIAWLATVQNYAERIAEDETTPDELRAEMYAWAIKAELLTRYLKGS